jgi:hypothetical protein
VDYNKEILNQLVTWSEGLIESVQDSIRVLNNPGDFTHDDVIAEFTYIERIRTSLMYTEKLISMGMLWGHDKANEHFEHNEKESDTEYWKTNELMHYVFKNTKAQKLMEEKESEQRKVAIKEFFANTNTNAEGCKND